MDRLAERMRAEKSPEARIGWAAAALLSLEPEHRSMLLDWITPGWRRRAAA